MYPPHGCYYPESPPEGDRIITYFDPVQCMALPITVNALEERRIAIWLSWFLGTWADNHGNHIHVEGNVAKCRHLYYRVVSIAKKKVIDSGMIYFDVDTYTIHLDNKFQLDPDFSDDLTVRWTPVNPRSNTYPLWTHIERLDRCAKWHVLNDIEVGRNTNVERYLMLKRKEMMSVLSSEDHAAVVVDKVEESTNSKAPDREPTARPVASSSTSSTASPILNESLEDVVEVKEVLDWRSAPDTKPTKPLEPVRAAGRRSQYVYRGNGYYQVDGQGSSSWRRWDYHYSGE